MNHLKFEQTQVGQVRVITVIGFMDMREVPSFEALLDELINDEVIRMVLDLTHLEFITSAGLGAIIGRIRRVRSREGDIKIGGCSDRVSEVLKVFGFNDVFDVSPTREKALGKFGEKV